MKIQLTLEEIGGIAQVVFAATVKRGGVPEMALRITQTITQRLGASRHRTNT
ncbi:MAG TPA: hypothetical protein VLA19_25565 [Herpetosiphonaceae bacterium]|nr:hypothetical protein [Herpetosiphonaceae bacterium]